MKKLILLVCCIAVVSLIACGKEEHKLTVTINSTTAVDGDKVYGKLCAAGSTDVSCTAKYSASGVINGNTCTFIVSDIEEDTYTGGVFIDLDGNADIANPIPDSGDLAYADDIEIDDDITLVLDEGDELEFQ